MIDQLPPKIHNAYWFQAFNAVSWQICLGSPLILFARELGAPAVVLGLLAGLAPLTSMLQLLVAPSAERIGYRTLMVKGWSARVSILIFLTALPLTTGVLPTPVVIALMVVIMLAFTLLRGVATCAWLPWLTAIVPRSLRGFYLGRDRMFISLASVAALSISGIFLFQHSGMKAYSIVFGISFLGGAASLYFLNRIPEPILAPEAVQAASSIKWFDLLQDVPFLRLLVFSVVVQMFVASTATFVTVFVRDEVQLQDGTILWITAGASLMGTLALGMVRSRVDRLGSRPFLSIVFIWWAVYFFCWFLMSARLAGSAWLIAPILLLMGGFFASIYDLSLTRLLMNTVGDRPATTQYFALHSVIVSVIAGTSPILWGMLLDSLQNTEIVVGGVTLDSFGIFFGLEWLTLAFVLVALAQVKEASSASTSALLYRIFVGAPGHGISVLTGRSR